MSDNKTAYRGEGYHLPQDGETTQYQQQQYGVDPNALPPQTGQQVNQNWHYGSQGQIVQGQDSQQFTAHDTSQLQGVDYSGIYGDANAGQFQQQVPDQQAQYTHDQTAQGYAQEATSYDANQYAQGYEQQQPATYAAEEANPYLAAHQNATPPYDATQAGYQQQDLNATYQDQYQDPNYYGQTQMDAGQGQFVDHAQTPSDHLPASYNANQPGYDAYYNQAGGQDAYSAEGQYGDYGSFGAGQNLQPIPQGMPQVNDPYATQPQHQHMAAQVEDDFQASGRKSFLVGTMILGSVIVGGGVAFAYKYSGDGSNGTPPTIISDAGKAKVKAENPGGRELANQNKKIFARLGDTTRQGVEEIITTTDGDAIDSLRGQVKDPANNVGAVKKQEVADAGGARKVKVIRINRKGEQIADTGNALKAGGKVRDITGVAVDTGKPARAVKILKADSPVKKRPVVRQEIADARRVVTTPPSTDGNYVVQISARRTEQDALAAFSGMKAKYGDALSGYRPLIQRADLGSKGVWYRLRVGPMASKDTAGSVCNQLKTKGLKSCFVTTR